MDDRLDAVLSTFEGEKDQLIPVLQRVQEEFGYLPEEAMLGIARHTRVPESAVYAVATFYAQFYLNPRGRQTVRVCRGTACHVRGGPLILEAVERELGIIEGETTPDLEYSLETVACIGACALAPTMVMNQNTYGKMTPNKVADVLSRKGKKEQEIA